MKKQIGVLATLSIALASVSPSALADFYKGRNAWLNNEPVIAISEWTPLAEAGDPVAQCYLGALYSSGGRFLVMLPGPGDQGPGEAEAGNIEPDGKKASLWFGRAKESIRPKAESGDANAQFCLGFMQMREMLQKGLPENFHVQTGLQQDPEAADKWFLAASDQGLPEAQMFYSLKRTNTEEGFNLLLLAAEQDYPEAVAFAILLHNMQMLNTPGHMERDEYLKLFNWIERGAQLNIRTAQDFLGRLYALGNSYTGMERDIAKAYFWYIIAGSHSAETERSPLLETLFGSEPASQDLEILDRTLGPDGPKNDLTAQQRKEVERLAREWKPKRF